MAADRTPHLRVLFCLLLCSVAALVANPSARADVSLCTLGSGAGQCREPRDVDADPATGWAYVADAGNNRIDVFDSSGSFLFAFGWGVRDGSSELQKCTVATGCQQGLSEEGQLARPSHLAVDHAAGVIYVTSENSFQVQEFSLDGAFVRKFGKQGAGFCELDAAGPAVAVGPSGSVFVGLGTRVQAYSEAGVCIEEVELEAAEFSQAARSLAVDGSGDIYTIVGSHEYAPMVKFDSNGHEICASIATEGPGSLAITSAGRVLLNQGAQPIFRPSSYEAVAEFDASCALLKRGLYREAGPSFGRTQGVAGYSSAVGEVFISRNFSGEAGGSAVEYLSFPPSGPVIPPDAVEAPEGQVGSTKAVLRAEVNPEGKVTQYHFEYLTQQQWGAQGESFQGPATKSTPSEEIATTEFDLHLAEASIGCEDALSEEGHPGETAIEAGECLSPEATYRYRIVATNADGPGGGMAEGEPFTTRAALELGPSFATEVGVDTARLSAEVNPIGIPTTGVFEYVDDATYQQSGFENAISSPRVDAGASELNFGAGQQLTQRSVTLYPLSSATIYHYRFSATDPLLGDNRVVGPEHVLRTFAIPTGGACPANEAFRSGPSAILGDCRAYEMVSPLDKESGDVLPPLEAVTGRPSALTASSIAGSRVSYGSYRAFGDAKAAPYVSQYVAERSATGWQSHTITPPRGRALAEPGLQADSEVQLLSPDLCDAWLATVAEAPLTYDAIPGSRNLYRRHDGGACGPEGYEALTTALPAHPSEPTFQEIALQGISTDHSVSVFVFHDNLEGTGAPPSIGPTNGGTAGEQYQVYERSPAGDRFVCVLPNGEPVTGACSTGTHIEATVAGVMRATSLDNAVSPDGQRIFWTDQPTVREAGAGQLYLRVGGTETVPVSRGGEEQSGTSRSVYLKANQAATKALYATFPTGGVAGGKDLYEFDLGRASSTLIAPRVRGVVGASEDLSRIYLVSEAVLSGANPDGRAPVSDEPNLYLDKNGVFTFVAAMADRDTSTLMQGQGASAINFRPFAHLSRVTTDGLRAIFMSWGSPTGYDNGDVQTGEAVPELYRYDAEKRHLVCASCNPTNARPVAGDADTGTYITLAGGWINGWENSLYAPRNLSADGSRVFFESADTLTPGDTNGVTDVYEWEASGSGGCSESASSYSPLNEGCVHLVSSGKSPQVSQFNDASPSGDDVFFSTGASLVSQDYGLVDIYDARVGGGLPVPPAPAAECEGEACQGTAAEPSAQIPSSLAYRGPGNVAHHCRKKRRKGSARRHGPCGKKAKKNRSTHSNGRAGR
jgi:hypothetical protein